MNVTSLPEKPTILVVDDTASNLALINRVLKEHYQVRVANCGAAALKLTAAGRPPDLILLDIMMPEMDGYEVCRRLKAEPTLRDIPVIFLTARSEPDDEEKGRELGAVDYIVKPIMPETLIARVSSHLGQKA